MLLRDVIRALLRRWYLVLAGLVLAVAAGYLAWSDTGPVYTASGSTVLIPPKASVQSTNPGGRDSNPLLYLGELGQARDVLASALASDEVQGDFQRQVPGASYSVGADPLSNGPIILYSVTAPSADVAVSGARYMREQVDSRLSSLQSSLGVYDEAKIRTLMLTEPESAVSDNKAQVRSALVVGVAVLLLCIFLVALVDGLAAARRKRKTAALEPTEGGGESTKDDAAGNLPDEVLEESSGDPGAGEFDAQPGEPAAATVHPDPPKRLRGSRTGRRSAAGAPTEGAAHPAADVHVEDDIRGQRTPDGQGDRLAGEHSDEILPDEHARLSTGSPDSTGA